jgi:ribulose-phosphate 3-epimerase
MLKCATSLWSADLANLASEIGRVEPYSERFHLDVADGHYAANLLFFPDLVAALRRHTRVPFEVHLMTTDPLAWIEPFSDAGADGFIFCLDSAADPARVIRAIRDADKFVGVSLRIEEDLERLDPYWGDLDLVTIFGTEVGIKGASMDPGVPEKVRRARGLIDRRGLTTEVEVDGGIRRQSVPLIHSAGADWIVPGSLMFGDEPRELRRWLATLQGRSRESG